MKGVIERYFSFIIIIVLLFIILTQKSCINKIIPSTPIIKIDTVFVNHNSIIEKKVPIYITLPGKDSNKYIPNENCDSLKLQYINLAKKYISQNIYRDTIKIDSIGKLFITDTVSHNLLGKRKTESHFKIPIITKTTIKIADPVRQLYIGGNIFGQTNKIQIFTPGLLYKTKQDNIYQINAGINFDGTIVYGIGAYCKIKL